MLPSTGVVNEVYDEMRAGPWDFLFLGEHYCHGS